MCFLTSSYMYQVVSLFELWVLDAGAHVGAPRFTATLGKRHERGAHAKEFEAESLSHDQDRHVGRRHIPRAERRAHRGQHAAA